MFLDLQRTPTDPTPLRPWVTDEEWSVASLLKPVSRRAEWLAWHAIVRRHLGRDVSISYNENGAPQIVGAPPPGKAIGYLSISHTVGWVAVLWSPSPCAIDIELRNRPISPTLKTRYSDVSSIEDWCKKEAAFKYTSVTGSAPDPASVHILPHSDLVVTAIYIED